jgi:hypothetical protein
MRYLRTGGSAKLPLFARILVINAGTPAAAGTWDNWVPILSEAVEVIEEIRLTVKPDELRDPREKTEQPSVEHSLA